MGGVFGFSFIFLQSTCVHCLFEMHWVSLQRNHLSVDLACAGVLVPRDLPDEDVSPMSI